MAAGRQRNGLHRDLETKGRITHYRVKWRTGGTRGGAWGGTTFDAHADAKRFKSLVEVYGHQLPPAEALIAKGFAYLVRGSGSRRGAAYAALDRATEITGKAVDASGRAMAKVLHLGEQAPGRAGRLPRD
jgi:hypothetical protein